MRWFLAVLLIWPLHALAQSDTVLPGQLQLSVSVQAPQAQRYEREMVLITIRGVYRRHITLERLQQPDFEGFSWTQLGQDTWTDTRINGEKVKVMERRMAIYPDRPGRLTIGPFVHHLTLTDEGDDWFDYPVQSKPVTISVDPAPAQGADGWWFPTARLKVADHWSNTPDQLAPGEGVLRMIRVTALGVTPEMIPPMPDLRSPSAMIFPHPDKRLIELTPNGPVTHAFWRWTIRPTNGTSTIVEPFTLSYFDTALREQRTVAISAQRVAYGADGVPDPTARTGPPPPPATLPGWPVAALAMAVFGLGTAVAVKGWRPVGIRALHRFSVLDPAVRQLRQAARSGRLETVRRSAAALLRRDGPSAKRVQMLADLDRAIYAPNAPKPNLTAFARSFMRAG